MTLINCVFSGNYASYGGAIHADGNSALAAINCTFVANYAFNAVDLSAAGVSCWGADCTINNSILWANSSLYGTNEIAQVSANAIINYSTVMGWTGTMGGIGNTGDYPFFVDLYGADNMVGTEDDDLRLAYGSPCIDAADNTAMPADDYDLDGDGDTAEPVPHDRDGYARFVDELHTPDTGNPPEGAPLVDMGAYEYPDDCNRNGVPDDDDLAGGTSQDCNDNGVPDECELDCNENGTADACDIADGTSEDCNGNGIPDECLQLEEDCNGSLTPDACDIVDGTSGDCNGNGVPDECEPSEDCNNNGIQDFCDIAVGTSDDCNANAVPDECDIGEGISQECNENGIPDECDVASGFSEDCVSNGIPDECEPDCNENGVADTCDIADGTSVDYNLNGIPDDCEALHVIYVDVQSCPGPGSGLQTDPFCRIQDAIDAASDNRDMLTVVHVGAGTYTGAGNRDLDFGGKAISLRCETGPEDCTIDAGYAGRGFHFHSAENRESVVDGFTIQGGSAEVGGGIHCENGSSPTISRCIIRDNRAVTYGGGIRCKSGSNAHVYNSSILYNLTLSEDDESGGAGISAEGSDLEIRDCVIAYNATAAGVGEGGGISVLEGNATIANGLVHNNYAWRGGGIWLSDSNMTVTNCTIVENSAFWAHSGGLYADADLYVGSDVTLANTIVWGNTSVGDGQIYLYGSATTGTFRYSVIQGGEAGVHYAGADLHWLDGNLDADPLFLQPDDSNFHLAGGSPCIDAGDNEALPGIVLLDLERDGRRTDDPLTPDTGNGTVPLVDMGAYEFGTDCNYNGVLDSLDVDAGTSEDCNNNSTPDECEPDCNHNGVADDCDIASGCSQDCNANGVPDECEPDCNNNGIPDICDLADGTSFDCNENGLLDECDIGEDISEDCQPDGIPDECQVPPIDPGAPDCNGNGVPDECEADCQLNGIPDDCDIESGTSRDCQANGIPDECDIASGTSLDANGNGIADECDRIPGPQPGGPVCGDTGDCTNAYQGADCIAGVCYVPKNRYLSIDPTTNLGLVAYQVEIVEAAHYPSAVGRTWWLDAAACYDYPNGQPAPGATMCEGADRFGWVSKLGSTPVTRVWTESPLHITGCGIVPDVLYEIRTSPDHGNWLSEPLPISTAHNPEGETQSWGDVTGGPVPGMPGLWLPPERATNLADVGNAIRTFENRSEDTGFPPRIWVDMETDQVINLGDISFIVMAFEGRAYADIQLELIGIDPAECP